MPIALDLHNVGFFHQDSFPSANFPSLTVERSHNSPPFSEPQVPLRNSQCLIELSQESLPPAHPECDPQVRPLMPSERISLNGYPEVGKVELIDQVHTIYIENGETLIKIGICQEQILLHLQETRIQTVFVEGLWRDFPAGGYQDHELSEYCFRLLQFYYRDLHQPKEFSSFIRNLFADFKPGAEFSDEQKLYLGLIGAPFIYAICNPEITLLKTVSSEDEQQITLLSEQHRNNPEMLNFFRLELRELLTMQEVKRHLDQQPGMTVTVIYGGGHQFIPQAERVFESKPPLISNVNWRKLEQTLGWNFVS